MSGTHKIGVFDSGLGGLLITKAIRDYLPDYDIVYLGDTLNVPYGNRSTDAVYAHSVAAIRYLFEQQDCTLVIMACNTANASALRKMQQEFLTRHYPDRRILGVVVPTLEEAHEMRHKRIGLLATHTMVMSNVYEEELHKIDPDIELFSQSCPLLVPLIENDGMKWIEPILDEYVQPLIRANVQSIILGCTHYPLLKNHIKKALNGADIKLISQDEIVPAKLMDYLHRHPEIDDNLSKSKNTKLLVTDMTTAYQKTASQIYGEDVCLQKVSVAGGEQ